MTFNSKVFLKGEKDPIICSKNQALSLQKVFEDTTIDPQTPLNFGRVLFVKEMIKKIFIHEDTEEHGTEKEYWIIYNPSKNSIWQKTFASYQDAKSEYDYQVINQSLDNKNDWIIEKRYSTF